MTNKVSTKSNSTLNLKYFPTSSVYKPSNGIKMYLCLWVLAAFIIEVTGVLFSF